MSLPIPVLLQGEMFFDYTVNVLWVGTKLNGNQQIPLSTLNGILFPDSTVQMTAATSSPVKASQTARVDLGVIASATPSLIISLPWVTPFVDNNYTVVGQVVILETPPDGAATAIVTIGSIQLQAGGAGINFVVCNADGLPHHVIANFIAVHD